MKYICPCIWDQADIFLEGKCGPKKTIYHAVIVTLSKEGSVLATFPLFLTAILDDRKPSPGKRILILGWQDSVWQTWHTWGFHIIVSEQEIEISIHRNCYVTWARKGTAEYSSAGRKLTYQSWAYANHMWNAFKGHSFPGMIKSHLFHFKRNNFFTNSP